MTRRWWSLPLIAFGVTLFVAAPSAFLYARFARDAQVQPIAFNHNRHAQENQIGCTVCHASYETETFSGLPDRDTCAACHSEAIGRSAEEKKLVTLIAAGKPLIWKPLFRQPAHVFYSHRRHVIKAGIACETCHGAIAKTTAPPSVVKKLHMSDCMDCHTRQRVAVGCTTCHR